MTLQKAKVKAYSAEHARRIASGLGDFPMTSITDTKLIKMPRQAKTCQTDDFPARGTRKWVTEYHIYSYGQRVPMGLNKYMYTNMEFVKGGFEQKTDAVKEARNLAIKLQLPMTVKIAKVLENAPDTVADLEPKTTPGEYEVTYAV